jgi:membrane protein DedA with SNARE-associated domain
MSSRLSTLLAALGGVALTAAPAWAHASDTPHLHSWAAPVILVLAGVLAAVRVRRARRCREG